MKTLNKLLIILVMVLSFSALSDEVRLTQGTYNIDTLGSEFNLKTLGVGSSLHLFNEHLSLNSNVHFGVTDSTEAINLQNYNEMLPPIDQDVTVSLDWQMDHSILYGVYILDTNIEPFIGYTVMVSRYTIDSDFGSESFIEDSYFWMAGVNYDFTTRFQVFAAYQKGEGSTENFYLLGGEARVYENFGVRVRYLQGIKTEDAIGYIDLILYLR